MHLINNKYLKEYSPIPLNFNMDEVNNYIGIAEDIWVKPLIGDEQYDELIQQIEDEDITEENQTLLLAIYPLLGFATCYEALPFITYHFSEVGATKGKSENSDSIDVKELNYIQQHLREQVVFRQKTFKKWIEQYGENYPLIPPTDCSCSCGKDGKEKGVPTIYSTTRRCTKIR
jgi:hypothetical protein